MERIIAARLAARRDAREEVTFAICHRLETGCDFCRL